MEACFHRDDGHPHLTFTAGTLAVHAWSARRFVFARLRQEVHGRDTGGTHAWREHAQDPAAQPPGSAPESRALSALCAVEGCAVVQGRMGCGRKQGAVDTCRRKHVWRTAAGGVRAETAVRPDPRAKTALALRDAKCLTGLGKADGRKYPRRFAGWRKPVPERRLRRGAEGAGENKGRVSHR